MLIDKETGYAIAATGAFERISRSLTAESEAFAIAEPMVDGPTLWVTYVAGETRYRGSNPMHAISVAREHQDVETVVDEVALWRLMEDWPASQPIFAVGGLDDAERGAYAPDVLDVLSAYGELTGASGAPLAEELSAYHEDEWYNHMSLAQQDAIEEVAYGLIDEVGAI